MLSKRSRHATPSAQKGLSIVEFMIGIAVGLFIVGGAIKLFVDFLGDNRRLLLEARVNQDLRAAADVVARDVRRAAYWRNAMTGVSAVPPALPASNPYGTMALDASSVTYAYDRDGDATVTGAEASGFRLQGQVLQMQTAAGWQALTDPNSVLVTDFAILNDATAVQWVELARHCECISKMTCTLAGILALAPEVRPRVALRWVDIVLEGEAASDSRVKRRIEESVRVRNDLISGNCPA